MELALSLSDEAEPLLADARATRFCVVVPSETVREHIVAQRVQRIERPRHPNESEDCPPWLLHRFWRQLYESHDAAAGRDAREYPLIDGEPAPPFDSAVYEAAYRRLSGGRSVETVRLNSILRTEEWSPYEYAQDVSRSKSTLVPTMEEASAYFARAEKALADDSSEISRKLLPLLGALGTD